MIANRRPDAAACGSIRTRSGSRPRDRPLLPARAPSRSPGPCSAPGSRGGGADAGTARASSRPRPILGAARRRRALLGGPAHASGRADVPRRRPSLCLPRLRDAFLRQRRDARGRDAGGGAAAGGRGPAGAPRAAPVGAGEALRGPRITRGRQRRGSSAGDVSGSSPRRERRPRHRRLAAHRRRLRRRGRGLAAALLRRGSPHRYPFDGERKTASELVRDSTRRRGSAKQGRLQFRELKRGRTPNASMTAPVARLGGRRRPRSCRRAWRDRAPRRPSRSSLLLRAGVLGISGEADRNGDAQDLVRVGQAEEALVDPAPDALGHLIAFVGRRLRQDDARTPRRRSGASRSMSPRISLRISATMRCRIASPTGWP